MPDNAGLEHLKHASANVPVDEAILRRWSPRAFTAQPVDTQALTTLFTAASWGAWSYNEQPGGFILGREGGERDRKIF